MRQKLVLDTPADGWVHLQRGVGSVVERKSDGFQPSELDSICGLLPKSAMCNRTQRMEFDTTRSSYGDVYGLFGIIVAEQRTRISNHEE